MLTTEEIKQTVTEYFKDKPVKKVYLFGSYARGEAEPDSDVDLLFSLQEDTVIGYFGLAQYLIDLEEIFEKRVDLVEEKLIYPAMKDNILHDRVLLVSRL